MDLIELKPAAIGGKTIQTVNARELHAFLGAGKDFSNWIKDRIQQYGFLEEIDYTTDLFASFGEKGTGRPIREYYLSIGMAKELAMVERNDKGREARRYFIECERKLLEEKAAEPVFTISRGALDLIAMHQAGIRITISEEMILKILGFQAAAPTATQHADTPASAQNRPSTPLGAETAYQPRTSPPPMPSTRASGMYLKAARTVDGMEIGQSAAVRVPADKYATFRTAISKRARQWGDGRRYETSYDGTSATVKRVAGVFERIF